MIAQKNNPYQRVTLLHGARQWPDGFKNQTFSQHQ